MKLTDIYTNRKQIFEGITNSLLKNEFVEQVSKDRFEVCNKCEFKGNNCIAPGTGPCCGQCGCSLKFKTRSLSSECPLNKWKALLTPEEEEKIENI
jgi:hypothetical protein